MCRWSPAAVTEWPWWCVSTTAPGALVGDLALDAEATMRLER